MGLILYFLKKNTVFLCYLATQALSPIGPIGSYKVHDHPGVLDPPQVIQPLYQYPSLNLLIKRISHWMPQRKSHKQCPRRLYFLRDRSI